MNVVVVGGGFAGVKAALELSKRHVGKITLISNETYFLHHATLYATATGRNAAESVISLVDIFAAHPNVTVMHDTVDAIDPARRLVIGGKKQYHYDEAILALGSVTTFFGIKGMAQHAFGIKSLDEIKKFKDHIHTELVDKKLDKEYFVIGAGPTGVELAAALQEYLHYLADTYRLTGTRTRVTLVEAAPRIVPRSSLTAARLISKRLKKLGVRVMVNHKVSALDDAFITIEGKKIPTTTAIWTSGVANNPFFQANEHAFHLAPNGRVNVNPHLQASAHVFVIGDSNTVAYSGTSWPALYQAAYVAKYLARRQIHRSMGPFQPHSVMCGIPVGEKWGYVEWMGIYVAGWPGFIVRRWMELYGYRQLLSLQKAVALWRAHDIPQIDT